MNNDAESKTQNLSIGRIIIGAVLIIGVIYAATMLLEISKSPTTNYRLDDASAIQVTQVYMIELFNASIIIGLMLAGLLFVQIVQLMTSGA